MLKGFKIAQHIGPVIITPEYEEWYNNMKTDLEKRLEYVRSQREILQRTEEELQKQLEAEKPEFDFRTKMPVGSVWLGNIDIRIVAHHAKMPVFKYFTGIDPATIYHAHQIVKAAQRYIKSNDHGDEVVSYENLVFAVKSAKQDGVLQNLE